MVGRIIGLVCCLLCAFPFFVINIYNKDSSEPIGFWSGDVSLKDKVKDIKGYILLVFDCSVGIYLAYRVYKGILKRYS